MPSVKAIEVRLDVANVRRSAAFYADMLGFEIGTLWPDDSPQFAILRRDGTRLQLSRREGASISVAHPCTLWLDVAGVHDLHSALADKVRIEWGPEVYFYGRREFAFRDPDGHLVILSEVTDDPATCEEAHGVDARARPKLGIVELKTFVPAKDFALSKQFYQDIGFVLASDVDGIAYFHRDNVSFLLQNFYVKELAENLMMHLLVENVDSWWRQIRDAGIADKYRVKLTGVEQRPWRMRDFVLIDPSGVLWRVAENSA